MAVQVAHGQVVRARTESAERWSKALERALANGLEVFQVSDTGERMVTSASRLDMLHRTDGAACTCEAALGGDPVCQHRAVVRFVMGWLPEPSPPAPARAPGAPVPARPCVWCHGSGRIPNDYDRQYAACGACAGIGTVPASRPREREHIAA